MPRRTALDSCRVFDGNPREDLTPFEAADKNLRLIAKADRVYENTLS